MRYVLDSSVAFKWVVPELQSDAALHLRASFLNGTEDLLAPDIFPGEVAHALTRAERQVRISPGEAIRLWSNVMTTCPHLIASLLLMPRTIVISSETRVGVFDCLYVALAEQEGCQMVTADSRLVSVLRGQYPFVIHLSTITGSR